MSGVQLWRDEETGVSANWEKGVGYVLGTDDTTPAQFRIELPFDRRKRYPDEAAAIAAARRKARYVKAKVEEDVAAAPRP